MQTPKTFEAMSPAQLRTFINGCHAAGDRGGQFEAAVRELNGREAGATLNAVLALRGYTTRPAGLYRKDILQAGAVVLHSADAGEVWAWLRGQGVAPWNG